MIGLADCNNFFVSCERSVDNSLEGKAVVVMSNNDGCVVARSNEAKALGIKMGQPVFEIRNLISAGKIIALSGQHLLYREISLKVHAVFRRFVPHAIDYSVDESFLDMQGIPDEMLYSIGIAICDTCWRELHIPVTIGFAPTKTLAKIMTENCKKNRISVGILSTCEQKQQIMQSMPINELWGIGRRLSKRLYQSGVFTIADFSAKNRHWVRSNFGINMERSWLELHGVDCIELSAVERLLQDSISETRTFPEDIDDYDYIRARIAIYAADCAKKLRAMRGACRVVSVFLRSNRFHPERGEYRQGIDMRLPAYTESSHDIVSAAISGLEHVYLNHVAYKRAGVTVSDIVPASSVITPLFTFSDSMTEKPVGSESSGSKSPASVSGEKKLMKIVDRINAVPGKPMLRLASQMTIHTIGHNDGYSSSFQAPFAPPPSE